MLRRLAEELEGAEDQQRNDARYDQEQEAREKDEAARRADERSIAQSLRLIEQHLANVVHHVSMGRVGK
jgi:hypothetical protein